MKTQFIKDELGKKVAVILPVKDYEKMLDELDELECIKAYDKARSRKHEFVAAEQVFKTIERNRKNT
jgi:PHD/YefM family antitoxin component YafN of YafNO toxin-antitoxin module